MLDDFAVAAVKTGMLASAPTVGLVADRAAAGVLPSLVVDPVMVASTGRRLLDDDAVDAYRTRLVPQALVVTPNLMEAAILAGVDPAGAEDVDAMVELARRVHDLGPLGAGQGGAPAGRPCARGRSRPVTAWPTYS